MFKKILCIITLSALIIGMLPVYTVADTKITQNSVVSGQTDFILDFEQSYIDTDGKTFYSGSTNMSGSGNKRGSHAALVTEEDGNKALQLTYDNEKDSENYNANSAMIVFDPQTKTRFKGVADTTYIIRFSYKVMGTDNQELQLFVANCGRTGSFSYTDLRLNNTSAMGTQSISVSEATDVINSTTDSYVTAIAKWTANGTDYPIIALVTNGKTADSTHDGTRPYASVLIDNITVMENTGLTVICHNYEGEDKDKELQIDFITTFSDLQIPSNKGYIFDGWYTDAAFTKEANGSDRVCNYTQIFVKWSGDGTAMTPIEITETVTVDAIKGFRECNINTQSASYVENGTLEQVGVRALLSKSIKAWYGAYVFSDEGKSDEKTFSLDNVALTVDPAVSSIIFYAELPDYEGLEYDWAISLKELILTQNSKKYNIDLTSSDNKIYYLASNGNNWQEATLESNSGNIASLYSGFKGYIQIDLSALCFDNELDLNSKATLSALTLGLNGELILGGILYVTGEKCNSTIIDINGVAYELAKGNATVVTPYAAYGESVKFDTRYSGTSGTVQAEYKQGSTSAFWATSSATITSSSGEALSTTGFMNTYCLENTKMLMQPSVDTFMIYVEMPKYSANTCGLKLLNPSLTQAGKGAEINFSNSIYQYLSIDSGVWKIARAGADGELDAITSGFKGYIKFDLKGFKGFCDVENIDFTKPYYLKSLQMGINHFGGENGDLVLGGLYSVMKDSDTTFIEHAVTRETLCETIVDGDVDLNGILDLMDLADFKKAVAGLSSLDNAAYLRAISISNAKTPNVTGLAKLKKYVAGIEKLPENTDTSNGVIYKDIFSSDYVTTNKAKYFSVTNVQNYQKIIEADTALNSDQKAIDFANEINSSKITDFEKTGIDKMCHVSTFLYANGNIYTSYYANTVSGTEDPTYQVARLAYCPEEAPENKIIIDIQSVGDDLYGKKVVGVYDTILMKKENDDTNLYILWTANIAGQYYRLYRIFNMQTETLGEIHVNRFKVGDITNDFSTSGIKSALVANNIGLKVMFSDIGIMQKLSTRLENGVTYYYTGAYSGNFTWIIKSKDLVTWEYVAQPDIGADGTGFASQSKWENAVYVVDNKVYYFVRQWDPVYDSNGNLTSGSPYGILTYYDLNTGKWETPVLVGDCQSRSDFIMYNGELYLFYAPTDRKHIGILRIDTGNLVDTSVVLQANMNGSCFYPFVQYNADGELCMSYTISRSSIRLASFTLSKYID